MMAEFTPTITIDSREPNPSPWESYFTLPVVRQKLDTGDYSVLGCERWISVERKALADLVACFCGSRDRFVEELYRFQAIRARWVIVEGSWASLLNGDYRSGMHPASAWASAVALMVRFDIPLLMAGGTEVAARLCETLLTRWLKEHVRMVELAEKAAREIKYREGISA